MEGEKNGRRKLFLLLYQPGRESVLVSRVSGEGLREIFSISSHQFDDSSHDYYTLFAFSFVVIRMN